MRRVGRIVWGTSGWVAGCALVLSLGLGGCFDDDQPKIAPSLVAAVAVSRTEPGSSCQALGAIEGRSDDDDTYQAAYETLRENAALRGGNYVVIDAVSEPRLVAGGAYDDTVVIRGRLYGCTVGMPYATVRYPVPAPEYAPAPVCGAP